MNKLLILITIMSATLCQSFARESMPQPVVKIDFEEHNQPGTILSKEGIGEGSSLVMDDDASEPYIITDKAILDQLSGVKSLTITGWIKRPVTFNDIGYQPPVVLNCSNNIQVTFERWGRLGLMMTGDDGRRKQIWGGWINTANFTPHNRWIFFAFSYDGTKTGPNCALYYGYEQHAVERETFRAADAGQKQDDPDSMWEGGKKIQSSAGMLTTRSTKSIVIGAYNEKGVKKVDGQLDNIRIYASSKDGSAALKSWQIEQVRLDDIGDDTFGRAAIGKAKKKADRKKEIDQIEDEYWLDELNLHQVDVLGRIFSDEPPMPVIDAQPTSVPRGGKVALMFAAMSRERAKVEADISIAPILSQTGEDAGFDATIFHVKHIPVEANNNGGINTTISTRPPQIWMEHIIREAPFQIAEVLIPTTRFELRENNMHPTMYKAILLDIQVPKEAKPGIYKSSLILKTENGQKEHAFSFRVHKTVVSQESKLNNVYWFKANPANLTTAEKPALWSDEHWKLIENSARTLNSYGQNTMSITLISHRDETINFIKTIKKADDSYEFDFSMFDKWFETFLKAGFVKFEGECTFGGHSASSLNVKAFDEKVGVMIDLFTTKSDFDSWLDFMAIFYEQLYSHLKQNGWDKYYVQGVIDEPTNMERYKKAYNLTKKYMPSIPTKEACGNTDYSDYIDIQVFNMSLFKQSYQNVAKQRRQQGKGVWFYHCASPYPPYPNRHLDDPLSTSRLFPWLTFMLNADGYLFWAANNYRTADPYKSSIGPLPGGIVNPGHPPGDDWMYYPGPDGLRGSMRMLAFRDGLLDYNLLVMLAEKDKELADKLTTEIIRSPVDYEKQPAKYHEIRTQLLNALDSLSE